MSLSKRLFYNVYVTNGNLTADIISTRSTVTNSVLTNTSVSNFISSNSSINSLIGTNISGTNISGTNISGGNIIGTSLTASNLTVSNITVSNLHSIIGNFSTISSVYISGTTITGGSLSLSGDLVIGGTLTTVNITTTNATDTNITSGNINITNLATIINATITNANVTTSTISNLLNTNAAITTSTISNLLNTNAAITTSTISNLLNTNAAITTSTIATLLNTNAVATNISTGTLNASTGITAAGARITDANVTTSTIATARITNNLVALGDSNTIGNIFTTGGNVGINIANPAYQLDVNGNLHVKTNLYVDGLISGGTDTGSTFAYLTLTSTDDAINLSTGSLLTYGGITVQSPTDAISLTNGGALLIEGGAAIGKRLFVGNGITSSFDCNTIGSIFTTGGNVGVNTTSPAYQLDVAGTLRISSLIVSSTTDATTTSSAGVVVSGGMGITKNLIVGGNVNVSGISNQFAGSFAAANNVVSETDITGFLLSNSVFGSFTSSINVKLVTLTQSLNAMYYIEGTQTSSGWIINDSVFGDDIAITFSITSSGQLQYTSVNQTGWISTTINYQVTAINLATGYNSIVPTSGNAVISGNLSILSTMDANSSSSASLSLSGGLSVIKSVFVGGNVGIGTTSPGRKLQVEGLVSIGNGTVDNSNYGSVNITQDDTNEAQRAHLAFVRAGNSVTTMRINNSNQFVIQNASGGVYLAGGATSWTANSDRTLKTDFQDIQNPLDKVSQIKGMYYKFKTDPEDFPRRIGVIAQDVQAVLPEIVATNNEGKLGVSYTELIPLLIEAIKELKKEFTEYKESHP